MIWLFTVAVTLLTLSALYIRHLHVALTSVPDEARRLRKGGWTKTQIREAYEKARTSPTDVKHFLFPRRGRRYIVVGGSGMVGGWIVRHLLLRGEDPSAIRVLDLRPMNRPDMRSDDVDFSKADITDPSSLMAAFQAAWKSEGLSRLPLTVFHTAALIDPSERSTDALPRYMRVNVEGTRNVISAARVAGADVLVTTSSVGIATAPINVFIPPWEGVPEGYVKFLRNADPIVPGDRLGNFASCYGYSKNEAEKLVRAADDSKRGFHTGCIRPGHAIYGHHSPNVWNLTWTAMSKGGYPLWIRHVSIQYVDAENVSIAHLAYENRLIAQIEDSSLENMGGRGYCVIDLGPPIVLGDFYNVMETLAHPTTPVAFPSVSPVVMICLSHIIEAYRLLRRRYVSGLPDLPSDLYNLAPSTMSMSLGHFFYDDGSLRRDLKFRHAVDTLEGLCKAMLDWNTTVEKRLAAKVQDSESIEVRNAPESLVPKAVPVA